MINLTAVIVAGIASMVLGAIWYNPAVFGKMWVKLSSIKHAKKENMTSSYIAGLIASIITAYVLAIILKYTAGSVGGAIAIAFLLWLGFIGTTTLGTVLWDKKPVGLYLLNNAYSLVSLLVMAAIIFAWPW